MLDASPPPLSLPKPIQNGPLSQCLIAAATPKEKASPLPSLSLSLNAQCRFLLCFDALKKIGLPQEGRRGDTVRVGCNASTIICITRWTFFRAWFLTCNTVEILVWTDEGIRTRWIELRHFPKMWLDWCECQSDWKFPRIPSGTDGKDKEIHFCLRGPTRIHFWIVTHTGY